jgi:hypothetical protein
MDILEVPQRKRTAGAYRHLATIMPALHFIPIKSRRLMPGGRAGNTVTRGWARPARTLKSSPTICHAGGAGFNQQGMIP